MLTFNTQTRLTVRKLAVLHQLYAHRLDGRITASGLISAAINDIFVSSVRAKGIEFFETDEAAAAYLSGAGFISSQLPTERRQKKTVLDLSDAIQKAIDSRPTEEKTND